MAINTAEKRRSAGGAFLLPFLPSVTPNAAADQEWREQAGWTYSGILVAGGPPPALTGGGGGGGRSKKRRQLRIRLPDYRQQPPEPIRLPPKQSEPKLQPRAPAREPKVPVLTAKNGGLKGKVVESRGRIGEPTISLMEEMEDEERWLLFDGMDEEEWLLDVRLN